MYAGGPVDPVVELLADDVVWHVPGASPIAGDHRGRAPVAAWLVPLDLELFDSRWTPGGPRRDRDSVPLD